MLLRKYSYIVVLSFSTLPFTRKPTILEDIRFWYFDRASFWLLLIKIIFWLSRRIVLQFIKIMSKIFIKIKLSASLDCTSLGKLKRRIWKIKVTMLHKLLRSFIIRIDRLTFWLPLAFQRFWRILMTVNHEIASEEWNI